MREISVYDMPGNVFDLIGHDWMLVTAGNQERGYNTMTASWGHMGTIWGGNKPTSVIYIRPQRYTKQFVDREDYYTLCFFPDGYRQQLTYLGTRSGRDEDKVAACGLTPVFDGDVTYFAEAKLTLVCRKIFRAPLKEEYFLDRDVMDAAYPHRDFHDMYVGEIVRVLVRE
ncbi:MAG: flavin reductase [Clostridia bacterium]|nr:flavin reductase [Clostridia bacterium]